MTFQAKQRPGLFGQGAFMINPNATPEEIKRKRQALDSGSYGDAQFLGEGVADLFKGIVAGRQRKQMDDIERKGRDGANATMERITSMLNGTPYTPTSAPTPSPGNFSILGMKPQAEEESIAADTMAALGKGGGLTGDMRTYADSIASIESAGSGDYTAMGPVTRSGDRAYGRYQVMGNNIPVWTEKYLGKRMTPEEFVNDPAAQDAVFAGEFGSYVEKYGNPQDAASMWFSGRPLAGNNRNDGYTSVPDYVSRFSSGIGAPMGGSAPTQQAPQVDTAMLYEALANPWMSAPQKAMISSLIQQRQQANDPMRQLQMQKAQLELEQMRNPTPQYKQVTGAELGLSGPQASMMFNVGPDGKVSQIGGAKTNVTVNSGSDAAPVPAYPKAPAGFMYVRDPETQQVVLNDQGIAQMAPILGGPEDTSAIDERAEQNRDTAADVITSAASRAREAARSRTVDGAFGRVASWNPESNNAELYRQVEVLKSNAKVENLNAMRAASKTGGALGSVTEKESQMLADKSGALDPASPHFLRDLEDYERTLLRVVHGKEAGDEIFKATRNNSGFPDVSQMDAVGIADFMKENPSSNWTEEQRKTVAARLRELRGQ